MKVYYLLPLIVPAFFITSCLKDKGTESYTIPCDTTYYYLTIKPIIETHCSGNNSNCHVAGGAGNGDFTQYSVLKTKIESGEFDKRVFDIKDMPPDPSELPPLSDADRAILEDWVNSGYPGCD